MTATFSRSAAIRGSNSFTPFRLGEGRMAPAGQAIYVFDLARKDTFAATFVPLRRRDAAYKVTFEPGVATYWSRRDGLELELTVFVAKSSPVEFKLLRIRNLGDHERLLEIVPVMEIVLAETPNDSLGSIETATADDLKSLYFRNPRNDFVKGWAFVSTSLDAEFAETSRRRFLGHESRDPALPYMVEHGHPDAGAPAHERKVAAFCGSIDVAAGGEALVVLAHGQTGSLEDAKLLASRVRDPAFALTALAESRAAWVAETSVLRIKTNKPDFDRLVNDWLPYQLLASRLWGRTGPSRPAGAGRAGSHRWVSDRSQRGSGRCAETGACESGHPGVGATDSSQDGEAVSGVWHCRVSRCQPGGTGDSAARLESPSSSSCGKGASHGTDFSKALGKLRADCGGFMDCCWIHLQSPCRQLAAGR